MRFETYQEAEQWVLARKSILVYYEPFRDAMKDLGNPQDSISCVHVGGTNGKGSTCRFLSDILSVRYQKIGLYTSPHLENIRDRIRINGSWIPEDVFLRLINDHMDVIETYNLGMVGICSMLCFLWFREEQVDIAVIEVSMGGRYDTTNVISSPLVSIITSIGFDHMEYLGNTLEEIAAEKAGIIKENRAVILGALPEEARRVITDYAASMHAEVIEPPECVINEDRSFTVAGERFRLFSRAPYLIHNALLALTAADYLGIDISDMQVRTLLGASIWPGRFETIAHGPTVILDGAHNPEGVSAMLEAAKDAPAPRIAVFSALKDKQGGLMHSMLEEQLDGVLLTTFRNERAYTADELASQNVYADWHEALRQAKQLAGKDGTVIITGSLYFISTVRRELLPHRVDS